MSGLSIQLKNWLFSERISLPYLEKRRDDHENNQANKQSHFRPLFHRRRSESFRRYAVLPIDHTALSAVAVRLGHHYRIAAWGLIALLIAVFPANIHMAAHPELYPSIPVVALWGRLPLQGVLILWAYWYTRIADSEK
jgi:hypothetical protein